MRKLFLLLEVPEVFGRIAGLHTGEKPPREEGAVFPDRFGINGQGYFNEQVPTNFIVKSRYKYDKLPLRMFVPNHLHLIIRAHVNVPPTSEKELNSWLEELVDLVGMKVVAGPTSVYVHDEGNEGVTGTITLATSHASVHVWDHEKPSLIQFDIYSCKEYSVDTVLDHLNQFSTVFHEWMLIDRNEGLRIISHGWWESPN